MPRVVELAREGGFRRYFEPFLGGGAIFFGLAPRRAVLSDSNFDLINAYEQVRRNIRGIEQLLRSHQEHHSREYYYETRRRRPSDPLERAAWLIYLNKTCYNGLWRVNSRGEFNVPMGSYRSPKILDRPRLEAASRVLRDAKLVNADFEAILLEHRDRPRLGDVVYLDPPYDPLTATSRFTSYTREGFGSREQERLASVALRLTSKGVRVIVSNSDTSFVDGLYTHPPFETEIVQMSRAINSKAAGRGRIPERLFYSQTHW